MLSVPEVTSTARRTGRAELDEHVQGVESAEIDVRLEMKDRPREAVLEELRQKVSLLPGTNVTIGQPISHRIDHMLSGTRANIAVKIFGDDLPTLRQLASQVQGQMSQVRGSGRPRDRGPDRHSDAEGARRSGSGRASRARVGRSRRSPADGARRPCRGSDSSGADRLSAGRSLRPGRLDGARRDWHDADPDTGPSPDSTVCGRDDSGGSWPELRHARERPAPNRRPEQRLRARPAQRGQRHSGARHSERQAAAGLSRRVRRSVRKRGPSVAGSSSGSRWASSSRSSSSSRRRSARRATAC